MSKWWLQPKYRNILWQVIVGGLVLAFIGFIIYNTNANLDKLHQNIDFSFLEDPAGFTISQTLIPYSQTDTYLRVFVVGLLNTLLISALSIVTATLLGVTVGILRLSNNWLVSKLAGWFVDIFRNIPLLLQIFFWYFAVLSVLPSPRASHYALDCNPDTHACLAALTNRGLSIVVPKWTPDAMLVVGIFTIGILISIVLYAINRRRQKQTGEFFSLWWVYLLLIIVVPIIAGKIFIAPTDYSLPVLRGFNYRGGATLLPELIALWIALTLYSAAYIAEYVRAGIASVNKGQYEAAAAIGLPHARIMRLVILPQALRVTIPPLTNQYLNIVKNSSLATAIAYPDLVSVFTGTTLNQTGRAIEIIFITMAVYLLISLIIALVMNIYNYKMKLKER